MNLATLIEKTKLSLRKSTYLERGISLYKKEEYEQALDCFEQEIQINPNSELAWLNRGTAFLISLVTLCQKIDRSIPCLRSRSNNNLTALAAILDRAAPFHDRAQSNRFY